MSHAGQVHACIACMRQGLDVLRQLVLIAFDSPGYCATKMGGSKGTDRRPDGIHLEIVRSQSTMVLLPLLRTRSDLLPALHILRERLHRGCGDIPRLKQPCWSVKSKILFSDSW
jgi:hypothetical protein